MDLLDMTEPARALAVKNVKHERDAREADIRATAEAQAARLEKARSPGTIREVEEALKADLQNVEERASRELEAVVHRSGADFRRTFAETTDLLGVDWPLLTAAVPRMPPAKGEHHPNEVAAS
jgi:hypothetical protein